jgi:hypothetical protein
LGEDRKCEGKREGGRRRERGRKIEGRREGKGRKQGKREGGREEQISTGFGSLDLPI